MTQWGCLVGLCWCACAGLASGVTLHVSPQGRDAWSGTLSAPNEEQTDGPLATLQGARDAVRQLRRKGPWPQEGVTVEFAAGRYEQLLPAVLEKQDSGAAGAPVEYRAAPGALVRVTGGVRVKTFAPVSDEAVLSRLPPEARGHVKVADLKAQGLEDYGKEPTGSKAQPGSAMQLTWGDAPMTQARWPNDGFIAVGDLPQGPKGHVFAYVDERVSRWAQEDDPHGMGYWAHDWAACGIAFEKIDPSARTVTERLPGSNYGFRKGGRFYGYNLLCELDAPGEYYVDKRNGKLYVWPPETRTASADAAAEHQRGTAASGGAAELQSGASSAADVSVGVDLLRLNDVTNLVLRGLTFECGRGCAIRIDGGADVSVLGCTIRNMGGSGIEIRKGERHRVAGCELAHLGNGGIGVYAGDPDTLTPSGHVIDNNHIEDFARYCLTYGAAVQVGGCGNRVSHNLIHDGPHVAVLFGGRENTFEYNEIHSVCLTSGEMGAFYTGRDWTLVGNVIRFNYVHDIYNPCKQRNRAVMLDDGAAGIWVVGNLFVRIAEGVSLSAVDNVVGNNLFVDCQPAVSGWQTWVTPESFVPPKGVHAQMPERLLALPVDASPWKERYPELAQLRNAVRDRTLRAPETRTRVERNVIWGGAQTWMVHAKAYPYTPDAWLVTNNLVGVDPCFVDAQKGDYRLRSDSPVFAIGFKPLPVEKMGLYASSERAVWPVHHKVRIVCSSLTGSAAQ